MHNSSFQSTWDGQRTKQKSRYSNTNSYQPTATSEERQGKNAGIQQVYGENRSQNSHQNNVIGTQAPSNYPELPNLKVPQQIAGGRSNAMASGAASSLASPRGPGPGPGPSRDILNAGRKVRGTSRQSNQAYRVSRRNQPKYADASGYQQIESGTPSQQNARAGADGSQTLPQIGAGQGGSSGKRNYAHQQHQALASSMKDVSSSTNSAIEEHNLSACTSIKGLKPGNPNWINQDNFFIIENFDNKDLRIYCVLDGHGENGHHASKRCREMFPQFIKASNLDIQHAFGMMQNDLSTSDIDVKCSGATCVMACVFGGRLSVYNCGDSRGVLGRRNPNGSISAHALSNDHKPDRADERKRILACGGHLGCRQVLVNQGGRGPVSMPVGPCRVWYQHRGETLGLAMSRSLGDTIVHKSGVSAEPELVEHALDDADEFLIIATDGVWDVVDNAHAVQMVHNFAARSANWSPLEASHCVTKFARQRWEKLSPMVDDITAIVIKLSR